ncbi:MAG TPA: aromatic aminobenezylarsenical efflux permease ArsG family transporter [bacterium]|nr:aromatic aminobenezylarsenical efflux permease ArsG family transporter [bacterium]
MMELLLAVGTSFWLGILTSVSPCPLATNIAAISFVSRRIGNPSRVFLSGLLYCFGRVVVYVVLGVVLVFSLLSAPYVSHLLQKYMSRFIGPVLILVGMLLLELLPVTFGGSGMSERMQKRVEMLGIWGAFLLGVLFALSFCPISAALFFGSLLPLALGVKSAVIVPAVYGLGTGLPVFVFALLLAFGARRVGTVFDKIVHVELWARRLTGVVFILVGLYYS